MVLSVKKEKSAPIHHRKRHGMHHKRGKDYDKHYWPYLPLLAIVGIGFGLNILWTPLASIAKHDVLGYATNTSLTGLLDETNTQRIGNGAASLQLNSQLNQAAQAKANDMVAHNYWSHSSPDGKEPWWFISNTGYKYTTAGENLAYGFISSSATVTGWMNSPSHRANLLNNSFQEVGFGIANSPDYVSSGEQTVIVALYAKPVSAATAVAPTASPAPSARTEPTVTAPSANPAAPIAAPVIAPTSPPEQTANPSAQPAVASALNQPSPAPPAHRVTRLETVASSVPAQGLTSTILAVAAALALFIYRHTRAWHRRFVQGERFILSHPLLDMALVTTVVAGFLLTRTAGFIN
jgi:hypothetical protein